MSKSLTSKLRQTNKGFPRKSSDSVDPFVSMTEKRANEDVKSISKDTSDVDTSVVDAEADVKDYVDFLDKESVEENKPSVEVSEDRQGFFEDVMFGKQEDSVPSGEVSDNPSPEISSNQAVQPKFVRYENDFLDDPRLEEEKENREGYIPKDVSVESKPSGEVAINDGSSEASVLNDIERRVKNKEPVSDDELNLYNEAMSQGYG